MLAREDVPGEERLVAYFSGEKEFVQPMKTSPNWRGRSTPRSIGMRPSITWGSLGLVTKRKLAAPLGNRVRIESFRRPNTRSI